MALTSSKRLLFTANYVTTALTPADRANMAGKPQRAMQNLNFVRALGVRSEDLPALREKVASAPAAAQADLRRVLDVAVQAAANPASRLEHAAALASVAPELLPTFAAMLPASRVSEVLLEAFEYQLKILPVGRLHLERLEMYPVGVERGEMVFTLPMAPGETVAVSHKEWSTSSREFEEIVQDSFETYSEQGVAEKSDVSMSTENQAKHGNTLNFGATLSGGYGPVSLTTTFGVTNTSEQQQSVKQSTQRNSEVTQKASARARQEHKVSLKLETQTGVADANYKSITNPSASAVRIDYYRMMRKWQTDLYRYGLRMTYDLTIPTPGVRLWARWQRLEELDTLIQTPLQFGLTPDQIDPKTYRAEALKVLAQVDDEPPQFIADRKDVITDWRGHDDQEVRFGSIEFDVPPGYKLKSADFVADAAFWEDLSRWGFGLLNASDCPFITPGDPHHRTSKLPEHIGGLGHQVVKFVFQAMSQASLSIQMTYERLPVAFQAWQRSVWFELRAAAEARHQEEIARWQEERVALYGQLAGKDTLSLRRLEREELGRLIMLWLLGPSSGFTSAPGSVQTTIDTLLANERHYYDQDNAAVDASESPTFAGVGEDGWSSAVLFGEVVKFVQQAVEWENLLYFLYPYYWGSEQQGRAKLLYDNVDPEHERFLRAGYVRVVLTIRPGFEQDFTGLADTGKLGGTPTSASLTIAQETANFARTNYEGIPPANPEKHARPLLYPQQRETWDIMQQVIAAIEQYNTDHNGFPVTLSDLPTAVPTDAWGNELVYNFPGSGNDYDLLSYGADGKEGGDGLDADISSAAGASLIASWFEYTPTSGIDIEVDTKPDLIA
jgi:hypothetical protein